MKDADGTERCRRCHARFQPGAAFDYPSPGRCPYCGVLNARYRIEWRAVTEEDA